MKVAMEELKLIDEKYFKLQIEVIELKEKINNINKECCELEVNWVTKFNLSKLEEK